MPEAPTIGPPAALPPVEATRPPVDDDVELDNFGQLSLANAFDDLEEHFVAIMHNTGLRMGESVSSLTFLSEMFTRTTSE